MSAWKQQYSTETQLGKQAVVLIATVILSTLNFSSGIKHTVVLNGIKKEKLCIGQYITPHRHTHTLACMHMHMPTYKHTHTCTHACMHTFKHTHTHTHTQWMKECLHRIQLMYIMNMWNCNGQIKRDLEYGERERERDLGREIWKSVQKNHFWGWMHVMWINSPQWCAWPKKCKKKHIVVFLWLIVIWFAHLTPLCNNQGSIMNGCVDEMIRDMCTNEEKHRLWTYWWHID